MKIIKAVRDYAPPDSATSIANADESIAPSESRGEAERRQLTVLFCDLVGSTALSRKYDPEDLRTVMRAYEQACQSAIERYGGHVARFMGDGVLAYFGYPIAHEDDAERAISAGLTVCEHVAAVDASPIEVPALQVRVGVATGPVVVGDVIGDGSAREFAAVGEAPNVAARLQGEAKPGEVLVAPLTQTLARGLFDFEPLKASALKGLDEPMQVFRVRGERIVDSRFDAANRAALVPLVGRDEELELLERRWRQAQTGQGQLVLIAGEAGIGKSRLVGALRERVAGEPHLRFQYQCSAHHMDSALYPVIRMLENTCRIGVDDGLAERRRKLEATLLSGTSVEPYDAALIASLLGDVEAQLPLVAQESLQHRSMTLAALVHQLEAHAASQPVLCMFEDMHWADPSTRDLIGLMVERIVDLPVLLVLTFRPEFQHPWAGLAHALLITLGRLTPATATRIVESIVGEGVIAPTVVDTVVSRGDGVPLHVEEIARAVAGSGVRESSVAAAAVPATLRDSLMARLDRLGAGKTVAQVGAVLGRDFDRDAVLRLSKLGARDVDTGLAALALAGIAQPRGTSSGTFVFKHALIQEAAYESLLRRRREALHALAAADLREADPNIAASQPELVAHHLTAAGETDEALDWWDTAARRAAERGELEESIGHLRRAIEILETTEDRDARAGLECDLRLRIADALRILDRRSEAFNVLDEIEPLAACHDLAAELARVHSMRGNLYFPLGETDACEREHALALKLARRASDRRLEANALGGLGDAWYMRGRWLTASRYFDDCINFAREGGFAALEALYLPMWSATLLFDLDLTRARERAMAGIESARREGLVRAQMMSYSLYAQTVYEMGRFEDASQAYEKSLELARVLGARRFESVYLEGLARVGFASGDAERAAGLAREAVAVARETGIRFMGPRCLGALALITADMTECEAALTEGEAVLATGCVAHNHIHYYRDAMAVRLGQGRYDDVVHYADALEAHFDAEPVGWSVYYARWARALVAHRCGTATTENEKEMLRLREEAHTRQLHHPISLLDAALR
jgi:class 3 adenylate cyclase/tetratricopeptide (TPR) repeat protein